MERKKSFSRDDRKKSISRSSSRKEERRRSSYAGSALASKQSLNRRQSVSSRGSQGKYEPPVFIEDELESSGYDSASGENSDGSDDSRGKSPKIDTTSPRAMASVYVSLSKPRSRAALRVQKDVELRGSDDTDDGEEAIRELLGAQHDEEARKQRGSGSGEGDGDALPVLMKKDSDESSSKTKENLKRLERKFLEKEEKEEKILLDVKESLRCVTVLRNRRKGWLSLWGFLIFAGIFLTMLNLWYDITSLSSTQKAFTQFFGNIEFAPGKFPSDINTREEVWQYTRALTTAVFNNTEYGYSLDRSSKGHIMRFTKVLRFMSLIKSTVVSEECSPPAWSKGKSPIYSTSRCYRLPDSFAGTETDESIFVPIDLDQGLSLVDLSLSRLINETYLDGSTTELKIQFWFYNPQTRYTSRVRALFSFNVFGGVLYRGVRVFPIRLFPYENTYDYFVALCQGLYALSLSLFVFSAIRRMIKCVRKAESVIAGLFEYWGSLWTIVDWLTNVLGITGLAYHFVYVRSEGREALLQNSGGDFGAEWIPDLSRYTLGLAAMFYSWKTLAYFQFEARVAMLIRTLEQAWPTLTFYAASLLVIMIGYAIGGHMIIGGTGIEEFKSFGQSFQSCFRMTTGEITLGAILPKTSVHPATKAAVIIFYWTFVLLVFFILLNMFIAIILDAYNTCMDEAKKSVVDHRNLGLFFLDGLRVVKEYLLTKLLCRPNGRIPKIAEDHCYVFLIDLHNAGKVKVQPEVLFEELSSTPGGAAITHWLSDLSRAVRAKEIKTQMRNRALMAIDARDRFDP